MIIRLHLRDLGDFFCYARQVQKQIRIFGMRGGVCRAGSPGSRFREVKMARRVFPFITLLLASLLWLVDAGRGAAEFTAAAANAPSITLTEVIAAAAGLARPTDIANAGDGRLFIVEKAGRIRVFDGATLLETPFLDISTLVRSADSDNSERGMLGLAFHPHYAVNGYFYVSYTSEPDGNSRIARYQVDQTNPNLADETSALVILEYAQDQGNHNGGDLNFGPDGYLYISSGDGGMQGDPQNRAQTDSVLLGKLLRIDVNGSGGADCDISGNSNYAIPPGNPTGAGICDEIWSKGLRNPWRASFDTLTGDLWIGEVGYQTWEEINFQPTGGGAGTNYGWRCYEGNGALNTTGCGPIGSYEFPVHAYGHGGSPYRCSVTGGYVYRGTAVPELWGHYLFADYCSDQIWSLSGGSHTQLTSFGMPVVEAGAAFNGPTTFGEDVNGELYVAENGTNASIFRITAASCATCNVTHDLQFSAGWNMISSHVDPAYADLETLLASIEDELVLMKNAGGQVFWPAMGINQIGEWDFTEGYQIYLANAANLSLTGSQVDPAQNPRDLPAGWTTLAYLRGAAMPIDQALGSISDELVIAKNNDGLVYWPGFGVNQIGDMLPGQGYQVYLSSPGSLTYPSN